MKKIYAIAFFSLIVQLSFSQVKTSKEFNYTMSKPYEVVDGSKWYFSLNDEVLALKENRGGFIVQKFAGKSLEESKRSESEGFPKGAVKEGSIQANERIYLFYSLWDKPAGKEQLFVRELDFNTLKFKNDKLLLSVKGKVSGVLYSGGMFSYTTYDKFNISLNFDESLFLVQYRINPEEKRDALNKDKIGFHTFDLDLNEVWNTVATMPHTEKKMNNVGYCLDNFANVYILAEVYKDETTKRTDKAGNPNYDLELIRIDADDQNLSKSNITLDDKFLTNYGFFEGNDNEIIISGYYSNDKWGGNNGMYVYRLDKEGAVISQSINEFSAEVLKQFESQRTQAKVDNAEKKGKVGLNNLKLRHLIIHADGSITSIGEVHYVISHYNSKTGQTTYTYYYEEMIVMNINPDGELVWMQKLPKFQYGGSPVGGMSFYFMSSENNMYFLFLDNIKNLEIDENTVPAKHNDGKGGYLTAYQVSKETGETKKLSIFDTRSVNDIAVYQFATRRIVDINDNEFAVEFYKKGKEDVMFKVTLAED